MRLHLIYWCAINLQSINRRYRKLLFALFTSFLLPTGLIVTEISRAQAQNVRISPNATGGTFSSVVQGTNATAIGSGASAAESGLYRCRY